MYHRPSGPPGPPLLPMSKVRDCYFRASRPKLWQISARVPRLESWLSAIIAPASPGVQGVVHGVSRRHLPAGRFRDLLPHRFRDWLPSPYCPAGWSDLLPASDPRSLRTMRGSSGYSVWSFRIPPASRTARFPRVTDWWSAWAVSAPVVYPRSRIREVRSLVCIIRNPRVRSALRLHPRVFSSSGFIAISWFHDFAFASAK